jgi:hypothetical protein
LRSREAFVSAYYLIKGLKVRVSDHEPNFSARRLRGLPDVELYTRDACGNRLDVVAQIEGACEKREGLSVEDFAGVIRDLNCLSETGDVAEEESEDELGEEALAGMRKESEERLAAEKDEFAAKARILENHRLSKFAKHSEIKALSEATGISQSFIKKYFGVAVN